MICGFLDQPNERKTEADSNLRAARCVPRVGNWRDFAAVVKVGKVVGCVLIWMRCCADAMLFDWFIQKRLNLNAKFGAAMGLRNSTVFCPAVDPESVAMVTVREYPLATM